MATDITVGLERLVIGSMHGEPPLTRDAERSANCGATRLRPVVDRQTIRQTIRAYENTVTRIYCRGRFQIMRQRFLQEIGQYLPDAGTVLDVGCGFGLFSLYYAQAYPHLDLCGMDLNSKRIEQAQRAARLLGVDNAVYSVGDARSFSETRVFDGAYMLDILHHIPEEAVLPLVKQLYACLRPGACLVVKDVDTRPAYKRWFTFALDKLIDPHCPVHYWESSDLANLLESVGFRVYQHAMVDYLPYPHVVFACWKPL